MKKILLSLVTIVAVGTIVTQATTAYFSDSEVLGDNTFAAGSLDLTVDGQNGENVVKFAVTNMRPGNQPKGTYTLANIGTINGYLDLNNITLTNSENGILEPEEEAGDTTEDVGELQDVVNLRLFIDRDGNGWISTGDYTFYDDLVANLPASFNLNELINTGSEAKIVVLLDWWNTASDNLAMTDGMTLSMDAVLSQNQ
ncbi:hypothetical protein A2574_02200 [Candidatus Shapirobacteria bacterium RIFOXYD1_FULL_38_32]|uniref:Uncharacterized protein n=3 Tax=Candidatus Shapironibacteriota TaxID=1752721 RepID=A0A0G0JQ38_9BACT|nr:MAG: hypothetical protein US90_C0013G0009 [Candidatus Shapirobacteria bacterium GW2011_GWE2_38_30]KKQ90535.1 MAG: hypothetical protein UT14_C0035G0006 [Candidatus Shapirobacteria bacterium GW2011_GWE1_38_92]OGL55702.1 MAG: hypothetical protein A2195_00065 [Candidatus Shapirobacteria bacterium RIFOXYA1_FULL_39_17]OGL57300.1 MAG: hypothetical protein A2367_02225 [Candidatus Shapirobacteria bacterium RIFOXYB1_FULL_38_38]OGL57360.1 MAG: hypothetical protein A2410_02640 [Candidatus Shapirobacteri